MKLKKFNEISSDSELQKYIKGDVDYQPLLNIFMSNRVKDYYEELGKYIFEIFDNKLPKELGYYNSKHGDRFKYSSVAIHFIASVLSPEVLKDLFGEPLMHNEFGEGFYDEKEANSEKNEEEDIEIERSEFDYASYFVVVNGTKLHIGYDHRGTNIEIDETNADKAFETIKELINMVKDYLIK